MTLPADRETVSKAFATLDETNQMALRVLMQTPEGDEHLLDGLYHHLDAATKAKLLNTMKLEKLGTWLGENAPGRLQVRLMETARASQHPVYQAFRTGLSRTRALERAYQKTA
ncbi:hypothetical protein BJF92_10910 [Rhizobium rhizosphaerae]|uniref:Uncharacterized protein n=1 Tax=Xaviernesmea rhizosphaerae TaxID=1672749 RepID=A0A1Q9AMN1_9HYPH|nr:hypothetical protein [Xaviernesmea rhizosphaerae]OLP56599.1 hypothetical protein BJF92_10910 [Xaviernesmea rhizosphaerae]OQP88397.1 hypothetical protein BTR14_02920 [Xaviernesmea rhizosphaerae]